jgi:hypothetical protein
MNRMVELVCSSISLTGLRCYGDKIGQMKQIITSDIAQCEETPMRSNLDYGLDMYL